MNCGAAAYIEECRNRLNNLLDTVPLVTTDRWATNSAGLAELENACRYALTNGGKRIRPVLFYGAADAVGAGESSEGLDHAALALEMIHTYSLVHDDLPAMDDDDLRRGKPSLHRAWDEATAILVGDALQARAFELIAGAPDLEAAQKVDMLATLAEAAGAGGMVGGQYLDISATGSNLDARNLQAMHSLKTGALIRASLALGGIVGGASPAQLEALDTHGGHIGLAFQVVDDLLDVEGDPAALGKTCGKDGVANKPTYVQLLGVEGARAESRRLLELALEALAGFGDAAAGLRNLARYIVTRDR
ncbi:MAG: farnesyl diphosphate synthase [Halioglobus sp.]|nr:farnesyl diphosphate synthase [Halioglobus sp.]